MGRRMKPAVTSRNAHRSSRYRLERSRQSHPAWELKAPVDVRCRQARRPSRSCLRWSAFRRRATHRFPAGPGCPSRVVRAVEVFWAEVGWGCGPVPIWPGSSRGPRRPPARAGERGPAQVSVAGVPQTRLPVSPALAICSILFEVPQQTIENPAVHPARAGRRVPEMD